jgi:hypothetical protein
MDIRNRMQARPHLTVPMDLLGLQARNQEDFAQQDRQRKKEETMKDVSPGAKDIVIRIVDPPTKFATDLQRAQTFVNHFRALERQEEAEREARAAMRRINRSHPWDPMKGGR